MDFYFVKKNAKQKAAKERKKCLPAIFKNFHYFHRGLAVLIDSILSQLRVDYRLSLLQFYYLFILKFYCFKRARACICEREREQA